MGSKVNALKLRRTQLERWLKESTDTAEQRTLRRAIEILDIDIQNELTRGGT